MRCCFLFTAHTIDYTTTYTIGQIVHTERSRHVVILPPSRLPGVHEVEEGFFDEIRNPVAVLTDLLFKPSK